MTDIIPAGYIRLNEFVSLHGLEKVRPLVCTGQLKAFRIDALGNLFPLGPREFDLCGIDVDRVFKQGRMGRLRFGGRKAPEDGDLVLVKLPTHASAGPAAKNRGGRPPKHDWEEALIELARLDADEGTANKTQAQLVRHLATWFSNQGHKEPADSDIKRRLKKYQDATKPKT